MINDLTLNQDCSCILISTSEYHKIYNCEPFGEFFSSTADHAKRPITTLLAPEETASTPTAYLKMLFSTSLTIIVPQSSGSLGNRMLKIYNLKQNLKICELTFAANIVNLRLNRKRLLVFLEIGQVYIYDLSCVRLVKVLEVNSFGDDDLVGDLSAGDESLLVLPLLVINDQTDLFNTEQAAATSRPSSQPSTPLLQPSDASASTVYFDSLIDASSPVKKIDVTLQDLQHDGDGWLLVYDTIALQPRLVFKAHNSAIARIRIANNSSAIATASVKGTIIRVFQMDAGRVCKGLSLRRGHNLAKINALSFNADNSILGCGSESNTIHLFKINDEYEHYEEDDDDASTDNGKSSEDLNENLGNLLVENRPGDGDDDKGYFNLGLPTKLINNHYTKLFIKKLPYKAYFDNLIWEPPRRSFAYIKLPEYTPLARKNKVEIGFSNRLILLASYQTGNFYQYQLPHGKEREECLLVNQYSLTN